MREIGINLKAVATLPDEVFIQRISELGFTATHDMARPREEMERLAALCGAAGIRFDSLHAPFRHINDIWLEGEDGERMLIELKHCVDMCPVVGTSVAVVHLSSGENPPGITEIGAARFMGLVEYSMKKGVHIAFENQRKQFNLAWAMETFGPETGVGFCWDCGHESCFTPGQTFMPPYGNRLLCTHIHDNMGIYNDDRHMLPFDGAVDFNRVARQLRASGFPGPLTLEVMAGQNHHYNGTNYQGMEPEEYLSRAAAAVKRLAAMLENE